VIVARAGWSDERATKEIDMVVPRVSFCRQDDRDFDNAYGMEVTVGRAPPGAVGPQN
jgi:hypothetical protein